MFLTINGYFKPKMEICPIGARKMNKGLWTEHFNKIWKKKHDTTTIFGADTGEI